MKNAISLFLTAAMIMAVGLGCGLADRVQKEVAGSEGSDSSNSNKTLTDKAVDTAVGEKKIGIPECDAAMDILVQQANNPDDNFVTKAIKQTALNQFREQLKKSLEDSQTDKETVAEFCREFKNNLEKSLSNTNTNSKKE